jgi:hypothetical protein
MKKAGPNFFHFCIWLGAAVLWWGAMFQPVQSRADQRTFSVASSSSGLTVEAHGVGVAEVLEEIGRQMGFTVMVREAVRPLVDVSLKDATLEEVFQQILRGENYALVYRTAKGKLAQGSAGIGKVLLLSPSDAPAVNQVAAPGSLQPERRQALSSGPVAATHASEAAQPTKVSGQAGWKRLKERTDAIGRGDEITTSDLLENLALQRVLEKRKLEAARNSEQTFVEEDAEKTEAEAAEEQEPPAVAAQRAQRNLTILIDGLNEAKDTLFNAQMNQGRGGH